MRTNLLNEVRALAEADSLGKPGLYYFRNEKTSRVPIVLEWAKAKRSPASIAIQFFEGEAPGRGDFECLNTFRKRASHSIRTLLLTHTTESYNEGQVEVHSLR